MDKKNNTAYIDSFEMTGNKCIRSFKFHDNVLFYHYYLFRLHKIKLQILIRTEKEFEDLCFFFKSPLFVFFQCITFYSPIYLSHKDLDVLLTFSLFFISDFYWENVQRQQSNNRQVLRSLLKLIKHREIRTDDNHAAFVLA